MRRQRHVVKGGGHGGRTLGGGDRARWVTGGTICRRWGLGDMKGGGGVKEPPFILLICLRDQFR